MRRRRGKGFARKQRSALGAHYTADGEGPCAGQTHWTLLGPFGSTRSPPSCDECVNSRFSALASFCFVSAALIFSRVGLESVGVHGLARDASKRTTVNKEGKEGAGTLRRSPIDFFNPRYGTTPSLHTFPRRAKITVWGCTSSAAPGREFSTPPKLNKKRGLTTSSQQSWKMAGAHAVLTVVRRLRLQIFRRNQAQGVSDLPHLSSDYVYTSCRYVLPPELP